MANTVRLGIIGVGNMGTSHTRKFADGEIKEMRLVAIADRRPERLKVGSDIHPGLACFDDGKALIDSGLCDAVIIAVPHY
ncbi:MAG: Gfo/Idh/MocA family oxidoreductase, partial [Clostridia bacterium]|nr:Gfo/Idh/MocA family oxidoreductase [Clostridia bacterium]